MNTNRNRANRRAALIHAALALGFFLVVIFKYKVFGS